MPLRIRGLGDDEDERQRRVAAFVALIQNCLGFEVTISEIGRVNRTEGDPDDRHRVAVELFDAIVRHRLELTISVGRGQGDVVFDEFARREVDLNDLDQLPMTPTADNPQIFTRCEALVHILAEYLDALNNGNRIGGAGYKRSHRRAFRAQERHRSANGQSGEPKRQHYNDDGTGGFLEYETTDGSTHRTTLDMTDGNVTGVR